MYVTFAFSLVLKSNKIAFLLHSPEYSCFLNCETFRTHNHQQQKVNPALHRQSHILDNATTDESLRLSEAGTQHDHSRQTKQQIKCDK